MRNIILHTLLLALLLSPASVLANEEFPGREKYPEVPFYELQDLRKILQDVVIVDARSSLEYNTLRIKGALHIPVASKSFESDVTELRKNSDKPIVFYCNGHKCMKSYIATQKAMKANIKNVFAYDAGIFVWTNAYPDLAVLLGNSPVNLANLIPKSDFKSRLLDPDTFSDRATYPGRKTMVIDVRDKFQRAGIGFYPGKERWASLDAKDKLRGYIKKAIDQERTLLIYDEVGKQVRWLQYELEKAGVKDYYFMTEGARGYYEDLKNWYISKNKKQ